LKGYDIAVGGGHGTDGHPNERPLVNHRTQQVDATVRVQRPGAVQYRRNSRRSSQRVRVRWRETRLGHAGRCSLSTLTVAAHVAHGALKECEDFPGLVVASGLVFGVDEFAVNGDIEHTFRARGQRQTFNDVLVVREKVFGCAHGVA